MKENSISYKTAKRETERLIVELEERAITHRAFTAECLKRVLKENEELKVELERQKDINTIINQKGIDKNYEKALEKSMLKFLKTNMAKDFVSVQKVKDKIEELQKGPLKINENNKYYYETEAYNKIIIQVLQDLIEGRK